MSGGYSKAVGKWHQPVLPDNFVRMACRWCQSKWAVADSDARAFCPECAKLGWKLSDLTTWRKAIRDGVRNRLIRAAANTWLREMPPEKCEPEHLPDYEDFVRDPEMLELWQKAL